jgi:hypothetical protein
MIYQQGKKEKSDKKWQQKVLNPKNEFQFNKI